MDLAGWLVAEHDDAVARLSRHILELIPADRRRERLPGANSVDWTTFHIARHASLALRVLGHEPEMSDSLLSGLDPDLTVVSAGLQEGEQPWLAKIDSPTVDAYALSVLDEARAFLSHADASRVVDVPAALRAVGLDEGEFGWLYRQWSVPHTVVRWPLSGHITHHVGELTGVRNQLGFSPFR